MDFNKIVDNINNILWNDFILNDELNTKSFKEIIKSLSTIKEYLYIMNQQYKIKENDNRTGIETYGYSSHDSIINNLKYISDRWQCQFRTKWLLDLIKLYK